ncbi:acetylserotonin O-methyltransferase, partial [Silurus meridionalis]
YPFKLLEYFNGFRMSKVIFSACEQGVFDLLMQSQKSLSAAELARELGASEDGMERLLDALVGAEVLEVELNQGTAYYSNTDVANLYLAKDSPKSLHDMIIYQSQTIYPLWNNLGDAVREGKNQNEKTFGLSSEDIFSAIYRSEDEMLKFMGLMNSSWVIDGHDVVTAFDLSRFKSIVDVGGVYTCIFFYTNTIPYTKKTYKTCIVLILRSCSGALARELSKAYPASTVTVLDLPKVIQTAQKHFCQSDDTIKFLEGDFFKDDLPAADLYVLARIIHDWKEEKSLPLLRKIHAACNSGGGVLLIEAMLFENHRGPIMAQLFSLNMLLQTEGKEHSPSHYTHMLKVTGFSDVQVCRTGKSYDAILALK